MAAAAQVPVYLYRHTAYEPDAEYVDGMIEERAVGERDHAAWQMAVALWFSLHADEWNVAVLPELRVQTSETRFRVPDVAVLDADLPREPIATVAPLAVFEVLSPEDSHTRLMRKLHDYKRMGISAIWVIDPETGVFERYMNGQLLQNTDFSLPDRGIVFAVSEIAKLVR